MIRRHIFPGIIFGLIGLNMLVVGITIYFATGDPSFAVEPEYDRKAMNWNAEAAQLRQNARLGWRPELSIGDAAAGGMRPVSLRLTSADGEAVRAAQVSVVAFHHARAAKRLEGVLSEPTPGAYEGVLPMEMPGLWEVRLSARRGDQLFTATLETVVPPGSTP